MRRTLPLLAGCCVLLGALLPPTAGAAFGLLGGWGGVGAGEGLFEGQIGGVASNAAGDVYVVDTGGASSGARIEEFDGAGKFIRQWGKTGSEAGEMFEPAGIAVAGGGSEAGNVYVADTRNRRIDQFGPEGKFIRAWGWGVIDGKLEFEICAASCRAGQPHGEDGGGFEGPVGVAVDPVTGDVYVSDPMTNDFELPIQRFDPNGEAPATVGLPASLHEPGFPGTFVNPTALAADEKGDLYAVDSGNERVQELNAKGEFLRTWGRGVDHGEAGEAEQFRVCTSSCQAGGTGTGAGDFNFIAGVAPVNIAVDAAGNVWVPDSGDQRVQEFTAEGGFELGFGWGVLDGAEAFETCTSVCRAGLKGVAPPVFERPLGAASAPSGCPLYVTDAGANELVDEFGACGAEEEQQKEKEKPVEKENKSPSTGGGTGGGNQPISSSSTQVPSVSGIATSPQAIEALRLGCGKRALVLNDVLIHGGRVALEGSAAKSLEGKQVKIVFDGSKQVATATVAADGQFSTTAPLPPARLRDSNNARYMAESGAQRSLDLKLTRRLELEPPKFSDGTVTLVGQVVPPLAKPVATVTVQQQLQCGKTTIVKRFKPSAGGRFRVNIVVPAAARVGIYRLTSSVAVKPGSRRAFATYSLPLPVLLG